MNTRTFVALGLSGMLAVTHGSAQRRPVQVGYCTPLRNIDAAKAVGFDYVELSTSEVAGLSDAEYEQAAARVRQVGLPVPVTNLFLPATLKVTGPDIDREQQVEQHGRQGGKSLHAENAKRKAQRGQRRYAIGGTLPHAARPRR